MSDSSPPLDPPLVGVLALQGAFREHVAALRAAGARTRLVRLPRDLDGLDGLVIPGGESTTMALLMEQMGLTEPVRSALQSGLPALATCAGMILLATTISAGREGQKGLGLLDLDVRRNAYGSQLESFEVPLAVEGLAGGDFPGVFIRAPVVVKAGPRATVLARHQGRPVAVRQGEVIALCFHPELSGDLRLHQAFVQLAGQRSGTRSAPAC